MALYRIEIAGPKNESYLFGPTQAKVRGRWESSKVAMFDKSEAAKALCASAPTIPGMVIELDTEKAVGRIYDPLRETNEGRAVFAEIKRVFRQYQSELGNNTELQEPVVRTELSDNDIKTWMFEMASAVDSGYARHVDPCDRLPSAQDVRTKVPGARVRDRWNTGPQEEKLQKYTDDVPTPAKRRGGRELAGVGSDGDSGQSHSGQGQGPKS